MNFDVNIHTDPGTRSSSTARLAMCVAAFCIADDKPKLEQNRLYGKTALPYGVASGSVDSLTLSVLNKFLLLLSGC